MSNYIPGHHWEVHAQVLEFDATTQKGKVQFIGLYGLNADGTPDPKDAESDPNYLRGGAYAVARKLEYLEPKAVYAPGEWVICLGVPSAPQGDATPHDLWNGLPPTEYKTTYYIIGALKHQPPQENLDHSYAARVGNAAMSFPPITYTNLPGEANT